MKRQTLRVLLVEDDPDDFLIIDDLLSDIDDSPYALKWVDTYSKALQAIREEIYDVCLVDYHLGGKTGLDFLVDLETEGKDIPVILLTGNRDRRVDIAAMQAGAADFLAKGKFDADLLERSIRYAIERSRLINALNEIAIRDELTGLYNRREMDRLMDDEFARCERYDCPFSLILLDIDNFKQVNDTYGHLVGDQVLKQLANIIKANVRLADRPIRFGGEEFALLLPETSESKGHTLAERLRKAVEGQPFVCNMENGEDASVEITISLGVADYPDSTQNKEALLTAADEALYVAKRSGRNQTVVFRSIDQKIKPGSPNRQKV
jgi:diguanylate cyclase (GGDEF)-like protein